MTEQQERPRLDVSVAEHVATLTLTDPSTLNAWSGEIGDGLIEALARFRHDDNVRAIIITGAGRGFCSGANLGQRRESAGEKRDMGAGLDRNVNPLLLSMRAYPKPLVAAVNGAAVGVGVALALNCDLIVMSESAFFMLAFSRVGLVPDGGASWLLPRVIGTARAFDLILLGERLDSQRALDWGLANRRVPDAELAASAQALAERLAAGPCALGLTRRLVWQGLDTSFAEQLARERAAQREAGLTEDFAEGVRSFAEKRPATFVGR